MSSIAERLSLLSSADKRAFLARLLVGKAAPSEVARPGDHPVHGGIHTRIESLGVYLPERVVSTDEIMAGLARRLHFPLEFLTGIRSRRAASATEFSIDLAKRAIAESFARSQYSPPDVDLFICANISRYDRPGFQFSFEPNCSLQLADHFGFSNAVCFDLANACPGMFTAISIVETFLRRGLIRCGLVASGEYITHLTATAQKELTGPNDSRLACLTLGDAGAALILDQAADERVGFHALELYTLGAYSSYCIAKPTEQEHGGITMLTDSVRLAAVSIRQAALHARHILNREGWNAAPLEHIIVHQTSKLSLDQAARELQRVVGGSTCRNANFINNLPERANTATTSYFVCLADHIANGSIKSGQSILFGIAGSGVTIGTALYTLDDLPDRLRVPRADPTQPCPARPPPIRKHSGVVHGRRVRAASVGTVPDRPGPADSLRLATIAAEKCLQQSDYERNDIGLVVYSGVYRTELIYEPAIAALIAGALETNEKIEAAAARKTLAFDIFDGALGFLKSCHVAQQLILSGKFDTALLVASEIENNAAVRAQGRRGLRETGSALLLDVDSSGRTGFGDFCFRTNTRYIGSFNVSMQGCGGTNLLHYEADPQLERFYLECALQAVAGLLDTTGLAVADLSLLLPPQISSRFNQSLAEAIGMERHQIVDVASDEGDLFSSALPYTLACVRNEGLARPGSVGLVVGVGVGVECGCALYYF